MSVTAKLYDVMTGTLLADISSVSLEKTLRRAHNGPRQFTITSIANVPEFTTVWPSGDGGDDLPYLRKGNRKLVVWEDDLAGPIFHGRITNVERRGSGGSTTPVVITAMQPDATDWGYDPDRAGRVVRGGTVAGSYDGNFINPKFLSSVGGQDGISGPDLIQQIHANSQNTGPELDPSPGEGPLPIDIVSGVFDLLVPPAIDLNPDGMMSWPKMIGDFVRQLIATGVCDYDLIPVAPGTGLNLSSVADPFVMVQLTARSRLGTDRSATVHFDYATGAFNAAECHHVEDFAEICNKLYDYFGPPGPGGTRWKGNITPGSPGVTVDPDPSRGRYGVFMALRFIDIQSDFASLKPLWVTDWNAEQGYRVEPRDLLFITPAPGDKALFAALKDYDAGDTVAINTGASMGVTLAETQRVYGFTKTWDRQDVARVSELLTSADPASL